MKNKSLILILLVVFLPCAAKKGPPDDMPPFEPQTRNSYDAYILRGDEAVPTAKPNAWDDVFWVYPDGVLGCAKILYVSPLEITVSAVLPQGFSGGGLFTRDGKLVAVYKAMSGIPETGMVYSTAERADKSETRTKNKGR